MVTSYSRSITKDVGGFGGCFGGGVGGGGGRLVGDLLDELAKGGLLFCQGDELRLHLLTDGLYKIKSHIDHASAISVNCKVLGHFCPLLGLERKLKGHSTIFFTPQKSS